MCAVDVARSSLDFSNTNQWGKKEAGSSPPSSGKWAANIGKNLNWCAVDVARSSLDFSNTNQWGKKEAGSSSSLQLVNGLLLEENVIGQKMTKKINVHPEMEILQTPNQLGKKGTDPPRLSSGKWAAENTNDESGPPSYRTDDRGCGYFMWMDDLTLHISSSSGSSTPPSYSPGTSTRPSYSSRTSTRLSYSPRSSRSAQNLGKAECSNCKFLAEKIKTLEAKIKILEGALEGALEMERHPEKHTLDSAAILHELYNEIGKLSME
ncbi:hypothetical protein Tco_0464226 [Tanacetum coccineum]